MNRRGLAVLIALDELLNAILGPLKDCPAAGNPHYTVSQRFAEMRDERRRLGCIGCQLLTWVFKWFNRGVKNYDHCASAMAGFPTSLPTEG
jgi:hypothetical protein